MERVEENRLIGEAVHRLHAAFPDVPQDTVAEIATSVHRRFDQAPIRDFVPLFVERQTKDKLAVRGGLPA